LIHLHRAGGREALLAKKLGKRGKARCISAELKWAGIEKACWHISRLTRFESWISEGGG